MPLIIQVVGQPDSRVFTEQFTVGRVGTDVVINDEYISPHHAVFRISSIAPRHWAVEDLGSTNGTWLNGYRVRGISWLDKGDKIRIGRTMLIVVPTEADLRL